MSEPGIHGIDLFKIAGESSAGWIPSFKTGAEARPTRQPFCSQMEEQLFIYLEYHPMVAWYGPGDMSATFASTYRIASPLPVPFGINYLFEGCAHVYLPDATGQMLDGTLVIAEAGLEQDKQHLAKSSCNETFETEPHFLDNIGRYQRQARPQNQNCMLANEPLFHSGAASGDKPAADSTPGTRASPLLKGGHSPPLALEVRGESDLIPIRMLKSNIEMRETHHRTQSFFIISQLIESLAENFNQEIK